MAAAFPLAADVPSGQSVRACCAAHPGGTCPDHYARSLEPSDETIAELQSIIVAMRHRRDSTVPEHLVDDLERHLYRLETTSDRGVLIQNLMALAAIAIRYREEL